MRLAVTTQFLSTSPPALHSCNVHMMITRKIEGIIEEFEVGTQQRSGINSNSDIPPESQTPIVGPLNVHQMPDLVGGNFYLTKNSSYSKFCAVNIKLESTNCDSSSTSKLLTAIWH
jgi:hypothetical protein